MYLYHHLVSSFRAGPGDVAVVRFRRWSPPQCTDALGVNHPSCLLLVLDTDNLVLYNDQWTSCTLHKKGSILLGADRKWVVLYRNYGRWA